MFTIKHIDERGAEHLWTAERPSFGDGVFTSERNGETSWVAGGTVYVMNEKGSTVATYRLAPASDVAARRSEHFDGLGSQLNAMRNARNQALGNAARGDDALLSGAFAAGRTP